MEVRMTHSTRRGFVKTFSAVAVSASSWAASAAIRCDVAVIGGGTGGCAAALAALRAGMKVALTEETGWIGGQLTS
jgi:NADPH-dependent 2,4-dienoyl-CoA reductase/sulfur reductase-like enzyme